MGGWIVDEKVIDGSSYVGGWVNRESLEGINGWGG